MKKNPNKIIIGAIAAVVVVILALALSGGSDNSGGSGGFGNKAQENTEVTIAQPVTLSDYSVREGENSIQDIAAYFGPDLFEYDCGYLSGYKLEVDDMIASGQSIIEVVNEAYKRNAKEIYAVATFAFFTEGVEKFDKLYEEGKLTRLYTTNLSYVPEEYLSRPWLVCADLSKFVAKITHTLNNDESISPLLECTTRIRRLLKHN